MNDKIFEITHDSLAAKIWEKVSAEEKGLIDVRNFISSAYGIFKTRNVRLSKQDIAYINPYLDKINLTAGETHFIKKSKQLYTSRKIVFFSLLAAVFLFLAIGIIYANNKRKKAEIAEQMAISAKSEAENNFKNYLVEQGIRKKLDIDRLLTDARVYMQGGYYISAGRALDTVLMIDHSKDVLKKVELLKEKINHEKNISGN